MIARTNEAGNRNEGSAFVISILVLFVLTVLGLALMLTTTTEKEISINHRWGEQAFFNADAALEYGKNVLGYWVLSGGTTDFGPILPPARTGAGSVSVTQAPSPDWGAAMPENLCNRDAPGCREQQYYVDQCPPAGGDCTRVYIGRVLRRPDNTLVQWDFRAPVGVAGDLDGDNISELEGTATVWVRRPIIGTEDYAGDDRLIMTAEGTAPNAEGAGAGRPVSVRRLEMAIRIPGPGIDERRRDDDGNIDSKKVHSSYAESSTN